MNRHTLNRKYCVEKITTVVVVYSTCLYFGKWKKSKSKSEPDTLSHNGQC